MLTAAPLAWIPSHLIDQGVSCGKIDGALRLLGMSCCWMLKAMAVPIRRWSEVANLSSTEDLGQFLLRVTSRARRRSAKGW